MASNSTPYRISPEGVARYAWVNSPDVKFNADGVFKTDHIVDGAAAVKLKAEVDAAAEAAFEEGTKDLTPAEKKKWSIFYPYEVEENDDGTPTGRIIFKYRQNAIIRVEGEAKPIRIAIFDSTDKPTAAKVFGGSIIRVAYKPRAIKLASAKQWGVRLDFLKVQVVKLAERSDSGTGGFGSVEGGYVEEHHDESATGGFKGGSASSSADY